MNLKLIGKTLSLIVAMSLFVACVEKNTTTQMAGSEQQQLQQVSAKLIENLAKTGHDGVKVKEIVPIEGTNLYWVDLERMGSVYITADAQYILEGSLLKLGDTIEEVEYMVKSKNFKETLSQLKDEDLIIYPATGEKKHTIYVFSDVSCSFCQKLHKNMAEMNAKGIEVKYVAWPRGESLFPAMERIWCSADRKQAFNDEMAGKTVNAPACENPVKAHFELGLSMGVNGTPAIFTEEGRRIGGYLSPEQLLLTLK